MKSGYVLQGSVYGFVLLSLSNTSSAQEETEAQWRVVNTVSATVIPLYNNAPSPFPAASPVSDTAVIAAAAAEELARQQSILESTKRAEILLESKQAVEPQLAGLQFRAAMQGPQGWSVLAGNNWVREGASFRVPVKASARMNGALGDLAALDAGAASSLSGRLAGKVNNTTADLKVQHIDAQKVTLAAAGGTWQIPIRQSQE